MGMRNEMWEGETSCVLLQQSQVNISCTALQYSGVQYSTIQYSTVRCSNISSPVIWRESLYATSLRIVSNSSTVRFLSSQHYSAGWGDATVRT